jgi:hypothetical protein
MFERTPADSFVPVLCVTQTPTGVIKNGIFFHLFERKVIKFAVGCDADAE